MRDHSSMRRSDGELNVSWPLKKAFSERLATPSKLPETGAAWMLIETGAEPPANRMSGLSEPASTEKFSPRQMPAADNLALRLSAPHSMAPPSPVTMASAALLVPPVAMTWPSLNSTVPNDSAASSEASGSAGLRATTARACSMAWRMRPPLGVTGA